MLSVKTNIHNTTNDIMKYILVLLLMVAIVSEVLAETITVRDKRGKDVYINKPVERAIFHINCELIPLLDIQMKVVGVGKWCYENDVLKTINPSVPVISNDTTDMNMETLIRLKPDIIISWTGVREEVEFLERRGLKVLTFYPESLDELYEMLKTHGRIFGKEDRLTLAIQEMKNILEIAGNTTSSIPADERKKGLWLGNFPNRVTCKYDLKNDLFRLTNIVNPASSLSVQHSVVSIEKIIEWNPDIIFVPPAEYRSYSLDDIMNNPQWRYVKAIKERRLYEMPHKVTTWSPSFAPIALWMASKAYPEHFQYWNIERIIDDFYLKVYHMPHGTVWKTAVQPQPFEMH
jgi:iron complex transport system substrate-binding protein